MEEWHENNFRNMWTSSLREYVLILGYLKEINGHGNNDVSNQQDATNSVY